MKNKKALVIVLAILAAAAAVFCAVKFGGKPEKTSAETVTETVTVTETTTEKADDTEENFKELALEKGKVAAFGYSDFDGDGAMEAFAITTNDSATEVWYIDSEGTMTMMDDTIELSIYENNGVLTHESGKSFFYADMGGYGSGWQTLLYSVKDSEPYELKLSKNLQGFKKKGETFYTSENDFTTMWHMYPAFELVLDETTGEFTKGECLNFDYKGVAKDYEIAYSQWMKKAVGTVDLLTEEFMQYTFLDIEGSDVPILVLHDWRIFYFYNFVDGKVVPVKDSEGEDFVLGTFDLPLYTNDGKFYIRGASGAPAVIYYHEITINSSTADDECIASACYAGDVLEDREDIENFFSVYDNDEATEEEYDKIVAEIESYEQIEFMPYTFG